jgi:hypothetical protein
VIIVGDQEVTGVICPRCEWRLVIYPSSLLEEHLKRHAETSRELEKLIRQLHGRAVLTNL